ncbi:glycogen debranching enzyme [Sanguibacter keddieii DSM 10542]|uniref:Glycogen debranching enzyme n=1 Tax=Sanguibacter keddieii (strain ATCC 51767 / DSM 10542 / NCFB 3025 / ST-74) TaxID=446469 RepID=D1BAP5_SANKS|nr:glycogen debranching N-terminal domain-containing protein [Sanguibacter keddieii]ACZ20596.1 glycogen debranching enzyme [Sanguibacter keddieii DSM 10542]
MSDPTTAVDAPPVLPRRQPLLHDLLPALCAPTQAWSAADGQVRSHGGQGFYHSDLRVLSLATVLVGGEEPETVAAGPDGPGEVLVTALLRAVDGPGADPTARLDRRRTVTAGTVTETLTLGCAMAEPVEATVRLELGSDLATMEQVKSGSPTRLRPVRVDGDELVWSDGPVTARVAAPGGLVDTTDPTRPTVTWTVRLLAGSPVTLTWTVTAVDDEAVVAGAPDRAELWSRPTAGATADDRLTRWVDQALDDLEGLQMVSARTPDDVFLAAGAPWFFTLFGRDSLIAARMMLPLGTRLAAGTLRTLAAYQGTRVDRATAEQPGKILHELRREELAIEGEGVVLPPVYYGTVDATLLWVCLLHDAWRAGLPDEEVEALLPHLEAALGWLREHADADGDGFLEYADETGHGLANQGWKDSGDSIQFADGTLAVGPIALAEVQGYAYEAAVSGAALLDAFGREGGDSWRTWAAEMAERFRATFWLEDAHGRYPGIALDGQKRVVDTLTSNVGHLLGTGILTPEEAATVAARLVDPTMSSGFGLRTMATTSGGYWPLSYHGGSVWTHDTAVVVAGLVREGLADEAAVLSEGLLRAAADFGYRVPELHSGDAADDVPVAVPYPAACRPQAWSAASAVVVLAASGALGLEV